MKSAFPLLAMALVAFLLAGCETAERLNDVRIGMTKNQVLALLGTPDSTSAQANVEYLTYYLETDPNYGRDRPYMVRLVEGKVESFGRFSQLTDLYLRPVTSAHPGDANFPAYQGLPGGAMMAPAAPMPVPASAPAQPTDLASEIERLKTLHDQGVLTDDEFQKAKSKLINGQ